MNLGSENIIDRPARLVPAQIRWLLAIAPILGLTVIAAMVYGLILPLVALVFDRWNLSADLVGLNAAAGTGGILLLGPFLPRIILRFGLMRIVAAAILAAIVALGFMAALPNLVSWFIFKVLLGLSLAIMFTSAELWINLAVDDAHRGRAFSIFTLLFWLGFACGPMIVTLAGAEGALPLLIGAGIMASGLLLLRLMPNNTDRIKADEQRSVGRVPFWPALIILATAIMAGMGDTSFAALLPTFGLEHGFSDAAALTMLTAFVAGGILFQWPVGWLADKVNVRALTFGCVACIGVLMVLLPMVVHEPALRLPLCFVAGGCIMSVSTLGLTMVGRAFAGRQLAVMSPWFSIFYEAGCTAGPVVAGTAMTQWGPHGLPMTLAVAGAAICLLFIASMARRRAVRAAA